MIRTLLSYCLHRVNYMMCSHQKRPAWVLIFEPATLVYRSSTPTLSNGNKSIEMPWHKVTLLSYSALVTCGCQFGDGMILERLNPHFWRHFVRSHQTDFSSECVKLSLLFIPGFQRQVRTITCVYAQQKLERWALESWGASSAKESTDMPPHDRQICWVIPGQYGVNRFVMVRVPMCESSFFTVLWTWPKSVACPCPFLSGQWSKAAATIHYTMSESIISVLTTNLPHRMGLSHRAGKMRCKGSLVAFNVCQ